MPLAVTAGSAERVQGREGPTFIEEAEHGPVRERIVADYLTKVVDAKRLRGDRSGKGSGDAGYYATFVHEAVEGGAGRLIEPNYPAAVVDAGRLAIEVRAEFGN